MDERSLIYDWNTVEYDFKRDANNHPHGVWFMMKPSVTGFRIPAHVTTIEQKIELLGYMEQLGIQKVDLGLPGAGPFHRGHIDAMLTHISENNYAIRPGAAVRTLAWGTLNPLWKCKPSTKWKSKPPPSSVQAQSGNTPRMDHGETHENHGSRRELCGRQRCPCDVCNGGHHGQPGRCENDLSTCHGAWRSTLVRLRYVRARYTNGVKKLLAFIDEEVIKDAGFQRRDIEVNWHGHQDRGLGVANNIAAVEAGADVIHGTALGVGERAGNAPLDQTLVNLKLMGVIENDLTLLDTYMQKANEYIEVPPATQLPCVWRRCF